MPTAKGFRTTMVINRIVLLPEYRDRSLRAWWRLGEVRKLEDLQCLDGGDGQKWCIVNDGDEGAYTWPDTHGKRATPKFCWDDHGLPDDRLSWDRGTGFPALLQRSTARGMISVAMMVKQTQYSDSRWQSCASANAALHLGPTNRLFLAIRFLQFQPPRSQRIKHVHIYMVQFPKQPINGYYNMTKKVKALWISRHKFLEYFLHCQRETGMQITMSSNRSNIMILLDTIQWRSINWLVFHH